MYKEKRYTSPLWQLVSQVLPCDPKEMKLSHWICYTDYTINKPVQQACKLLQRLEKPVTVYAFLTLHPAQYRGFYGIGDNYAYYLLELRRAFLSDWCAEYVSVYGKDWHVND